MGLPSEIISQFVKISKPEKPVSEGKIVTGTAKEYAGKIYVQLDGSDQLTPVISSTAGMKDGDRVTVLIKDHSASVTGNVSSPSTGQDDLDKVEEEIGNKISEFEIIIADKVSVKEFDAEKARIDNLVAENVTINGKLDAVEANIGDLNADNVTINEKLEAQNADIENLKATKLDAEIADIKYATIKNLEATNANIHNLEADYGDFKELTSDKITANEAAIKRLDTEKLSAKEAELKYANIDFANIGSAAIENFLSKSGMIGDLVVGDGTVTGTLVGVTIKGDLIEGGTVVADKLVIKGEDGLYYKLNTDGETVGSEQTEYNSLNGSVITAKSVTAEKISVNDLVAFDATIGGFNITESSIYSGVKESVDNTTRGIYMDDDGQFAIGDSNNYLKYFKMEDGTYKLALSVGGSSIEDTKVTDKKSGYLVDIGPNAGKPPIDVVVYGDTKQNLWKNPSGTSNGVTVTSNEDGSVTLNGTATQTVMLGAKSYRLKPSSTYLIKSDKIPGDSGQATLNVTEFNSSGSSTSQHNASTSGTLFTTSSELSYTSCRVIVAGGYNASGTYRVMLREATEDEIAAAQLTPGTLQEGGTADIPQDHLVTLPAYPEDLAETTPFEWCKPGINGVEPTAINISGKNLLAASQFASNCIGWKSALSDVDGWIRVERNSDSDDDTAGVMFSSVKQWLPQTASRLVLSFDAYCENGVTTLAYNYWMPAYQGSNSSLYLSFSIDTEPKRYHASFGIHRANMLGYLMIGTAKYSAPFYIKNVQIGFSSDDIEYEPYSGSSTPLDLDGHQLHMLPDGTRDELHIDDVGTVNLIKKCKSYTCDGTEEIIYNSTNNEFSIQNLGVLGGVPVGGSDNLYCDKLPSVRTTKTSTGCAYGYSAIYVAVKGVVTSKETAIEWLKKEKPTFVFMTSEQTIKLDSIVMSRLPSDYAYAWAASDIPAYMDVTYWTVAGKDVSDKINDAQNSANDANNKIDEQLPNIEYARSQIEILNKSIATLVVDENGGSLMTQTSDGWKFNIGGIQSTLDDAVHGIQDVKGDMAGIEELANQTNALANDVAKKTAYINMTQDESGAPVMELGQQDGEFKLRITNTSMDFMQGSQRIAYLSNRQLYIQSSVVTDEMKIGATSGYIWKKRANGNMGLRYVTE